MTPDLEVSSQPRAWRPRIPTNEERAAELTKSERAADADRLRDLVRTAAACVGWLCVGLFCLGWSLHTADEKLGRIAFAGGLVIGNAGILATMHGAFMRAQDRGDL